MIKQGTERLNSPTVWLPDKLDAAWELKQQLGSESCYIAGGTLLQTQWQKSVECPRHLISLEKIKEMTGYEKTNVNGEAGIRIGALTTLAACKEEPSLFSNIPLLQEAVKQVAAPAVRNRATVGGNLMGKFGDLIPALMALDAYLSFYDGDHLKLKRLLAWSGEINRSILTAIFIPENQYLDQKSFFYKKLGFREAFTPSIVTISGCCQLNSQKEVLITRLAAGGSTTPYQRLSGCEKLLEGFTLSNQLLEDLFHAIREEFTTADDAFTSADYKKTIAANMIVSKIAGLAG
ncbi:FAD binding domain-containing protein [Bacillus sp. USDA818B3_A]|uniref:FAD binding domain-containing protein n=1 Tax=Bacillus sp. USDA818B3_A TaxID=2698834 RepID=UPI001F24333D|nr:FAD binding domain-containing protein [Bacillus sp. USDA818B3_A]